MGWEIVSDLMSSLEEWLKGKLADGIVGCLQSTCDTLSNTFSSDNKGMMKMFLKDRPEEFTGVTSGGTPIWSGIETITNNAIVPIAMFVLVVVLLYELIQMVISGNNFREFDMGIFFKWSVKALCGILLISNVFYIATNVFLFGSSAVNEGLSTLFSGSFFTSGDPHLSGTLRSKLITLEVGTLLILLLLACLIAIVAFVVLGAIIVVLSSRMIEKKLVTEYSGTGISGIFHRGSVDNIQSNSLKCHYTDGFYRNRKYRDIGCYHGKYGDIARLCHCFDFYHFPQFTDFKVCFFSTIELCPHWGKSGKELQWQNTKNILSKYRKILHKSSRSLCSD